MSRGLAALTAVVIVAGCGDNEAAQILIAADPAVIEPVRGIAALAPPTAAIEVRAAADPAAEVAAEGGLRIGVVVDLACTECYRIDASGERGWVVHAGDVLGAQYGVANALENLGFRFRNPFATYAPRVPVFDPAAAGSLGVVHTPQTRVRGFQLHTLHPIEAYYAVWEPGADRIAEATRIFSWIAANRGNYVQWVGLNDIMRPDRLAAWRDHTAQLLALAHARGLRVGLGVQLFGQSNLQLGFDLSDDDTGTIPLADELADRLPRIIDGVPFDVYAISFGEFYNADPARFVAALDEAIAAFHARTPAEVHAIIHVGEEQRVDYMGETGLLYYFLVKFADPSLVHQVHSVMFYNLYEDTGGAYHHDNFDEHRAYLLDRIATGKPAMYQPETAYWVAFDISVPVYLPLYVRSRWLDLDRLRDDPAANGNALDGHILFTSGWEWGYWLNDYTALRASYELPADWRALIADAFGADLAPAVDLVAGMVEDQQTALIDGRLAAYLAGRDALIDAARASDIVSQPERITFDDLAAATPADRAAFAADILPRLDAFAAALEARAAAAADLDISGPWADELREGIAVTATRARFAATAYHVAIDHLAGDPIAATAGLARLDELLAQATELVAARRLALHYPQPARILDAGGNATFYGYGYLLNADTLCFWRRELIQLQNLTGVSTSGPPNCVI